MARIDAFDIRPTPLDIHHLHPLFAWEVTGKLAHSIGEQVGVSEDRVADILTATGKLTQFFIDGVLSEPSSSSEVNAYCQSLAQLTGDERVLASLFFVRALLGRENDPDSNIDKFTKTATLKALYRGDDLDILNTGKQRVGTTDERVSSLSMIALGLSRGASNEKPYYIERAVYLPIRYTVKPGIVFDARQRVFVTGGGITGEESASRGNETRRVDIPHIHIQNYLHRKRYLGSLAQMVSNAYQSLG